MSSVVDLSPLAGYRIVEVPTGTVITDLFAKSRDVTVDDSNVAICRGKMFVTEAISNRLREAMSEKRP